MGRRRRGFFGRAISFAYRLLSTVNTLHVMSSGDPGKIARHFLRKKTVKLGAKVVPPKR